MTLCPRTLLCLALVAIVSLARSVHGSVPTCSGCTGPVLMTWASAQGCLGGTSNASSMSSYTAFNGAPADTCTISQTSGSLYFKWRCTDSGIISDRFYTSGCTGTPYFTFTTATNLCFTLLPGTSSAYFCSSTDANNAANVTTLPQTGGDGSINGTTPLPTSNNEFCSKSTGCPKGVLSGAQYFSSSCSGNKANAYFNPQTKTDICYGTSSSTSSTKSTCDGSTLTTNHYYGDCDTAPVTSFTYHLNQCILLPSGNSVRYSCNHASSILASMTIMILMMMLIALVTPL